MKPITEDKIETFAIEVLQSMGWEYVHGLAIAPGAEQAERENASSRQTRCSTTTTVHKQAGRMLKKSRAQPVSSRSY